MRKFFIGFIVGLVLLPLAFAWYCLGGYFPAAATDPPLPFEPQLAMKALHAAVDRRAPKTVPIQPTESNLVAGAQVYRQHCSLCHGLPGQPDSPIAAGLSPSPPHLLEKGQMVTDDPAGETYWKAMNGIRLSGMPSFMGSLSNEEIWQVSLFLANADRLPPAAQQALTAPQPPPPAAPGAPGSPAPKSAPPAKPAPSGSPPPQR